MNNDIYNNILSGDIKNSLYNVCSYIINNDKIIILEITLINVCSYIGSFINIINIKKYIDILQSTRIFIENNNVKISDILTLITKMCIICNDYNKNITIKTGLIPLNKLKEKLTDIFNNDTTITSNNIHKFESILPPKDSDSYLLSIKIINGLIKTISSIDKNPEDDYIFKISDKLKNSFDYIIRKNYYIETKIIDDGDIIYFLWGFISILFNDIIISDLYWLYNYEYLKKYKKQRNGLLYGCAIIIIYLYKKNLSTNWDEEELNIINKINNISLSLFNEVKDNLKSPHQPSQHQPSQQQQPSKINNIQDINKDPLTYLYNYVPRINNTTYHNPINPNINNFIEEDKIIPI